MADHESTGGPLPAIWRIEQALEQTADRAHATNSALFDVLCAYTGTPPAIIEEINRRHREHESRLRVIVLRLRAIRHQLSQVLP
jgi:hypothetical protein